MILALQKYLVTDQSAPVEWPHKIPCFFKFFYFILIQITLPLQRLLCTLWQGNGTVLQLGLYKFKNKVFNKYVTVSQFFIINFYNYNNNILIYLRPICVYYSIHNTTYNNMKGLQRSGIVSVVIINEYFLHFVPTFLKSNIFHFQICN